MISLCSLHEIATQVGREEICSERELIEAIRQATNLDENSAIVHLDPSLAPMVYEVAHANLMSLGETLTQYVAHGINQGGYLGDYIDLHYVNFTPEEWKRFKDLLGFEKNPTGSEVVQKLMQDAQKSVRLSTPQIPPVGEVIHGVIAGIEEAIPTADLS